MRVTFRIFLYSLRYRRTISSEPVAYAMKHMHT